MHALILPTRPPLARLIHSKPPRFRRVVIGCCLILAVLSPTGIAAETKPMNAALELRTLEDFHAAAETVARKPVTDAETSYRAKLEKHQKTAQAAGNLKSLQAARQAIGDLDAGQPPSISSDSEVAAIQKSYIAQRQKADAETEIALAKAENDHLASLKRLVVELTKAGHIDQAQEVQGKVEAFEATLSSKTTAPHAVAGQEIEIWKKKALEEFPALKDPASPLSKRVQALKVLKKSNPGYFSDPQWPYLLAKEANIPHSVPSDRSPASADSGKSKTTIKGNDLLEGEALKVLDAKGGKASTQDMRGFGKWSDDAQLFWLHATVGSTLTLVLPVKIKGRYQLKGVLTKASDYGIVTISLDGKEAFRMFDGYNEGQVIRSDELDWGVHLLEAGDHKLTFVITGANPSARKKYLVGLDYVRLRAIPNAGGFAPAE